MNRKPMLDETGGLDPFTALSFFICLNISMKSRKSTSGLVCMHGQHLIIAKTNLQAVISLSSCEAEFYAAVKALAYALFLRAFTC